MSPASDADHAASTHSPGAVWRHVFAGLCASLVGIGLARFAYTPLIPPLIQAHWFSKEAVVYLSAANLAGYLVGAVVGRAIAAWSSNRATLRWMMVLVTAAFLACAYPVSAAWFFGWRFLSGVAGGAIMALVAATLMPHMPSGRRELASGAIFLGLGLGIAGSGTLVPLLLDAGLPTTWQGLAVVSGLLTAATWSAWPAGNPSGHPASGAVAAATPGTASAIRHIHVQYALMAVGLVPGMVFFADFIARGLGAGARTGSLFWMLYGLGAMAGPPLYGWLADRGGARRALRMALAMQLLSMLGLIAVADHAILAALTVLIGTFPPGVVPLVLARVHDVLPHDTHGQNTAWGRATMAFAAAQALAAYGYSALFARSGGDHRLLFVIGAAALALALLLDVAERLRPPGMPVRSSIR